jgi:hypothetical protein
MIQHHLDEAEGILTVMPQGPFAAGDFEALRAEVDPFIERVGALRGLVIEAEAFPGWDGFSGLTAHPRFVRDHHRLIRRVAVVSDSAVLSHLPQLTSRFVAAVARHFAKVEREGTLDWVRSAGAVTPGRFAFP